MTSRARAAPAPASGRSAPAQGGGGARRGGFGAAPAAPRSPSERLVLRPAAAPSLRAPLERFLSEGALDARPALRASRESRVARVRLDGRALVVKRYRRRGLKRLATFARASRAEREGRALEAFHEALGNPVRPLAWSEERRLGTVRRCHLVTAELEGAEDLKALAQRGALDARPEIRRALLEALPALLAALHGAGFFAKTLHAKNVLVEPATGRVALIDLRPARRRLRWVSLRARVYDLAALEKGLRPALGDEDWRAFLHRYADAAAARGLRADAGALEHRVARRARRLAHGTRGSAARHRLRRRLARTRLGTVLSGRDR